MRGIHWLSQYTGNDPGVAAVTANLRYPAAVLAAAELAGVIDLDRAAHQATPAASR